MRYPQTVIGAVALLVFLPSLWVGFLSDDISIIYNGIYHQRPEVFFRPASVWFNHAWFGTQAFYYHFINIFFHALCSIILFYTTNTLLQFLSIANHKQIAWVTAILFATYPYHIDSVVWCAGIASVGACLFLLLSFYFLLTYITNNSKHEFYIGLLSYFISTFFYESAWGFPLLFFCIYFFNVPHKKKIRRISIYLIVLLGIHISIRYYKLNTVLDAYSSTLFQQVSIIHLFKNSFRFLFRSIAPPIIDNTIFLVLGCLLFLLFLTGLIYGYVKRKFQLRTILLLGLFFYISLIPVLNLGISSDDSEGERYLYFPSCFFILFVSYIITSIISHPKIILSSIVTINFIYLFFIQLQWISTSRFASTFYAKLKKTTLPIVISNLPNTINGVYCFRNGFEDGLNLYGIQSSVHVQNKKMFIGYSPQTITQKKDSTLFIQFQ